jgi:hypothetical protein
MPWHRPWKSIAASFCASLVPATLMFLKSWLGLLPSFQPYDDWQRLLRDLFGGVLHPALFWVVSLANAAALLGFLFGHAHAVLPGRTGVVKGLAFSLGAWIVMGLVFFPLIGAGPFALYSHHGAIASLFTLAMILTYGASMGAIYSALGAVQGTAGK